MRRIWRVSALKEAITKIGGLRATSRLLGLSVRAVAKWRDADRLPRTELTGETDYSTRMAKAIAKNKRQEKQIWEALLATCKRPPRVGNLSGKK